VVICKLNSADAATYCSGDLTDFYHALPRFATSLPPSLFFLALFLPTMPPNQNMQAIMLGSPPTLACPHCLRHFRNKSGRTQHILAKHNAEVHAPKGPSLSLSPSPLPSPLPQSPSHELHHEQPSSPIEHPNFDRDETPPGSYFYVRHESSRDSSPGDCARDWRVPGPPRVTRVYHPKLYGKSRFLQ
jgi:hypothetical protein